MRLLPGLIAGIADRPGEPWPLPRRICMLTDMRLLPGLIASIAACAAADPGLRIAAPPHPAALTEPTRSAEIDRADLTFAGATAARSTPSAGGRTASRAAWS